MQFYQGVSQYLTNKFFLNFYLKLDNYQIFWRFNFLEKKFYVEPQNIVKKSKKSNFEPLGEFQNFDFSQYVIQNTCIGVK